MPPAARIFAVVDVYDALMSNRPYRDAWPREQVLEHLRQESGSHFDPSVVAAFLDMVSGQVVTAPAGDHSSPGRSGFNGFG